MAKLVLITHDATQCSGEYCCIHNPSKHHMRDWPQNWRSDTGVMERICPHGVGHPDPDDAAHNIRIGREYLTVHGCDGCCRPKRRATPRKKVTKKKSMTYKCVGVCRRTGMTVKECGGSFHAKRCPYCQGPILAEGEEKPPLPDPIEALAILAESEGASKKGWLRRVLDDAAESKKQWPKWAQE